MRLLIAAAPVPRSHDAMYWMPTLTFVRNPASVMVPPGIRTSSSCSAVTSTSGRWRSSWFGRFPRARSNSLIAVSTRSGCATQVPSKPSVASRFLSSRTFASAVSVTAGSRRLGMNAAIPPSAKAPRLWHVFTRSSVYARMNGTVIATCPRSGRMNSFRSPSFLMMLNM